MTLEPHAQFPRQWHAICAPSSLGLSSVGVERLAERLIEHGLQHHLNGPLTALAPAENRRELDPASGVLNAKSISEWSPRLADAVGAAYEAGHFPLILGGDCSILLGTMLALRRRGRYGLLHIDGHADFYLPGAEPNGEAASMDLALVTGRGPELLSNLDGLGPLVRDDDAVAFGFRDADEQAEYGSPSLPPSLLALDLAHVQQMGAGEAARIAVQHVARPELDGFFVHLDADVLDDELMPAVDYRLPGGLAPEELTEVLAIALGDKRCVGLEVTVYNPDLDADGAAGALLAGLLTEVCSSHRS